MTAPSFDEARDLDALMEAHGDRLRRQEVARIAIEGESLPVWCLEIGSNDLRHPAIGFFGGVHGMERIGTQVLIAWMQTLLERVRWDAHYARLLESVRIVFMPMVNPGGLLLGTRANPAGVDLMRSAPVQADGRALPLMGGHRVSPRLPWYRGQVEDPLPAEAAALFEVVRARLHPHPFSIAVDCHSGFGFRDRIWFPYARTREPVPHLAEAFALRDIFNRTYPNHSFYLMEPQSASYTTHGDLWDFLYDEYRERYRGLFLPFTLEMGSWLWVKKNPRQFFSWAGLFNPILPHRLQRVLRRHLILFDFLLHATASHARWQPAPAERVRLAAEARKRWFPEA